MQHMHYYTAAPLRLSEPPPLGSSGEARQLRARRARSATLLR